MLRLLLVVALLCLAPLTRGALAAPPAPRCFDPAITTVCIDPSLVEYWEQNGGVAVFGYPIGPASAPALRAPGGPSLVQWFERNRLEVHPEHAGTPYAIQIGLVGKEYLAALGRGAEPPATPREDCLWFPETGHNVCNNIDAEGRRYPNLGFKAYWESHGLAIPGLDARARSLALFGLPLASPRRETTADGAYVLVQWFERARFEWHLDNPDEFKVLLGRLGDDLANPPTSGAGVLFQGMLHGTSGLNVVQVASGRIARLGMFDGWKNLALSPDGRWLAGLATIDGATGLAVARSDGTEMRRLTSDPVARAIDWSPDNRRLVYWAGSAEGLFVINADGTDRRALLPEPLPPGAAASAGWSPDGRSLLLIRREAGGDGRLSIARIDPDGRNYRLLAADAWAPAWSPDGREIAFLRELGTDGTARLFVMAADGTGQRWLVDGVFNGAAWSPDGRTLSFSGHDRQRHVYTLNTIAREGGTPTLITDSDAFPYPAPGLDLVLVAPAGQQWVVRVNTPRYHNRLALVRSDGSHRMLAIQALHDGDSIITVGWRP